MSSGVRCLLSYITILSPSRRLTRIVESTSSFTINKYRSLSATWLYPLNCVRADPWPPSEDRGISLFCRPLSVNRRSRIKQKNLLRQHKKGKWPAEVILDVLGGSGVRKTQRLGSKLHSQFDVHNTEVKGFASVICRPIQPPQPVSGTSDSRRVNKRVWGVYWHMQLRVVKIACHALIEQRLPQCNFTSLPIFRTKCKYCYGKFFCSLKTVGTTIEFFRDVQQRGNQRQYMSMLDDMCLHCHRSFCADMTFLLLASRWRAWHPEFNQNLIRQRISIESTQRVHREYTECTEPTHHYTEVIDFR
jgi:hypothetical protein